MRRITRARRVADQSRRMFSLLLITTGAIVILSPLFSHSYANWEQNRLLKATDNPIMVAAPPATPAPAAADPPPAPTPVPAPTPAPVQQPEAARTLTVDRSSGFPAMRLEIPALNLRQALVAGIDLPTLTRGPGHYPDTPLPGEPGNASFAGHRTQKGVQSFFYDLNKLKPGDEIRVVYPDAQVAYAVERVWVVPPTEVQVVGPTPYPALTLTTCDPPGTEDQRLIVRAKLVKVTAGRPGS